MINNKGIIMYGKGTGCEACDEAKEKYEAAGIDFKFVDVTKDREGAQLFRTFKRIPLIEYGETITAHWWELLEFRFIAENNSVKLPTRSTEHSAGYDFHMPKDATIPPHGFLMVDSKVSVKMPNDYCMMLLPRSSNLIKRGIAMPGGVGLIDPDYTGTIGIYLENRQSFAVNLKKDDRIAQGVFVQYGKLPTDQAKGRREGGFGSTGD